MLLPKFNLCCGKDNLRPSLQYVNLSHNYIIATDARILAWQESSILDTDLLNFIESSNGLFIHHSEWKKVAGKEVGFLDAEKHSLVFTVKGKKTFLEYKTGEMFEKEVGRYPKWESVLPVSLDTKEPVIEATELSAIGLNPKHLATLGEALGISDGARLDFFGTNKPVMVTDPKPGELNSHWSKHGGIIMPMRLDMTDVNL